VEEEGDTMIIISDAEQKIREIARLQRKDYPGSLKHGKSMPLTCSESEVDGILSQGESTEA
jgi:hypothetical protein